MWPTACWVASCGGASYFLWLVLLSNNQEIWILNTCSSVPRITHLKSIQHQRDVSLQQQCFTVWTGNLNVYWVQSHVALPPVGFDKDSPGWWALLNILYSSMVVLCSELFTEQFTQCPDMFLKSRKITASDLILGQKIKCEATQHSTLLVHSDLMYHFQTWKLVIH